MKVTDIILGEWKAIWRDKRLLAVMFIIPVAYMVVFGSMYSQGQVQELPTIYIDESNTQVSQQMLQAFDQSSTFQLRDSVTTEQQLIQMLETGNAAVGIIIPADFSEKLKQNSSTGVLVLVDGSNMMISNAAVRNANEIVQTFSGSISVKRLEAKGIQSSTAPIQYSYRILYNPGFSYGIFLLLGLMGAVIQQIMFMGISLAITREKESGTWSSYKTLFLRPWRILYAKSLPYFLIGCVNILIMNGILIHHFSIPFLGSYFGFVLLSIAFLISVLGIGFLASLVSKSQLAATQITMLVALPSFLLSGFTWPFDAMPGWVAAIGHCLPLTYFLHGMREIAIKGNGLEHIIGDVQVLLIMAFGSILISLLGLYIRGRKISTTCESK